MHWRQLAAVVLLVLPLVRADAQQAMRSSGSLAHVAIPHYDALSIPDSGDK